MDLTSPTHPRLRWERSAQWTDGEWVRMLIWKFQSEVEFADVALATHMAAYAIQQNYPNFAAFPTQQLEWICKFGQKLADAGTIGQDAGKDALTAIPRILGERKLAQAAMEAEEARTEDEAISGDEVIMRQLEIDVCAMQEG
jgi:hypothetical protein